MEGQVPFYSDGLEVSLVRTNLDEGVLEPRFRNRPLPADVCHIRAIHDLPHFADRISREGQHLHLGKDSGGVATVRQGGAFDEEWGFGRNSTLVKDKNNTWCNARRHQRQCSYHPVFSAPAHENVLSVRLSNRVDVHDRFTRSTTRALTVRLRALNAENGCAIFMSCNPPVPQHLAPAVRAFWLSETTFYIIDTV